MQHSQLIAPVRHKVKTFRVRKDKCWKSRKGGDFKGRTKKVSQYRIQAVVPPTELVGIGW